MGWFDKIKNDLAVGEDSVYVKNYVEAFIVNEQQFTQAFNGVGRDLSRIQNYYQQFEMMQGILDKLIALLEKHERIGTINNFLAIPITMRPFGKIPVQEGYRQIQDSVIRMHTLIGQNYFTL